MNNDDLLFSADDVEMWKNGDLPDTWLDDRMAALRARLNAQSQQFNKLLIEADPAMAARLRKRL